MEQNGKDKVDRVIKKTVEDLGGEEPPPGKQDSGTESTKVQVPPDLDAMKSGHSGGHKSSHGRSDIFPPLKK